MARKLLKDTLADYMEYAKSVNVHVKPVKGVHSGAKGRPYEMAVKVAITPNSKAAGVAKAGRIDHRAGGIRYEIKTGCGEICRINPETGEMSKPFGGADYVIYCPFFNLNEAVETQSYVVPTAEMVALLEELGLVRTKASTSSYRNGVAVIDRITIQSFSNSRKKEEALYAALDQYPKLGEWLEQ